jgi:hypothetical protein
MYQELRLDRILETLRSLQGRIDGRFPGSGLGRVAGELTTVGETTAPLLEKVRRPNLYLRAGVAAVILLLVVVMISLVMRFQGLRADIDGFSSLLQTVESGIQDVVFLSAAIYFLATIEGRRKRRTVLENLHRLRSIVHVIDMHQLTKDPEQVLSPSLMASTAKGREMTRFELVRYLDYCAEMLSICSKMAALHVQYVNDPVVLDAVNDIEVLASDLASRIWQKIVILDTSAMIPGRVQAAD